MSFIKKQKLQYKTIYCSKLIHTLIKSYGYLSTGVLGAPGVIIRSYMGLLAPLMVIWPKIVNEMVRPSVHK